jgi:hypothetical protein
MGYHNIHACIEQACQCHEAPSGLVILGLNLCVHESGLEGHEVLIPKILHLAPEPPCPALGPLSDRRPKFAQVVMQLLKF